ncbi:MAG: hypothetical protein HRU23_11620 [Gammaproteobacteria bacterium]|nr:hypothetical protein [Gammaproteobacteria bacterium]
MTNYKIHGNWQLSVNNKVLIQVFSGSWNEEAAIAYIEEFKVITQPLLDSPWAILSLFDQWQLGTQDINPHIKAHCRWFIDHGCVRDCHVYAPNILKKMVLESLVPYQEKDYERQVFSSINDAISWLAPQGFPLEPSDFLHQLQHQNSG